VMTKIINNTNARSNSGVMLISLKVTNELRCEKRLMAKGRELHIGNCRRDGNPRLHCSKSNR